MKKIKVEPGLIGPIVIILAEAFFGGAYVKFFKKVDIGRKMSLFELQHIK